MRKIFLSLAIATSLSIPFSSSNANGMVEQDIIDMCNGYIGMMQYCADQGESTSQYDPSFCDGLGNVLKSIGFQEFQKMGINVNDPRVRKLINLISTDCKRACKNPGGFWNNMGSYYNRCSAAMRSIQLRY